MSNFSDLYDAIVTRIETVLPNHTRLPNPYKVDENTELFLRQGWGVALTSGTNPNRNLSCRISTLRSFDIIITRKFYSIEAGVTNKQSTEKELIEDQLLVIRDFCNNTSLPSALGVVNFESDGGIEYVFSEKDNFLVLRSVFGVEYFDNV